MKAIILSVLVSVSLAVMGVAITPEVGKALFKKAQAGDAQAQFELAECFAKGDGVKKDTKQAKAWYEKAAAQKYAQAQLALKDLLKASLRGAVEIKEASPAIREAKGLELVLLLLATTSYAHESAAASRAAPRAGATKMHAPANLILAPKILKPDVMKKIIELTKEGADLDVVVETRTKKVVAKDKPFSCSPISLGVDNRDWALVEFLLANKAKLTGTFPVSVMYIGILAKVPHKMLDDRSGIYNSNMEKVTKLLELGMDPNETYTDGGLTILGTAMTYNAVEAVELLIKAGADVNGVGKLEHCMYPKNKHVVDRLGDTPIMYTYGGGCKEAILLLLKYKPDLSIKNRLGQTILDVKDEYLKDFSVRSDFAALKKIADEIEEILVKQGAKRAKDL